LRGCRVTVTKDEIKIGKEFWVVLTGREIQIAQNLIQYFFYWCFWLRLSHRFPSKCLLLRHYGKNESQLGLGDDIETGRCQMSFGLARSGPLKVRSRYIALTALPLYPLKHPKRCASANQRCGRCYCGKDRKISNAVGFSRANCNEHASKKQADDRNHESDHHH